MTIHLIPCHSTEIEKAWKGAPLLDKTWVFIRGRKDGTYMPLSEKTIFYTPFEVLKEKDSNPNKYKIHWDKKAVFSSSRQVSWNQLPQEIQEQFD